MTYKNINKRTDIFISQADLINTESSMKIIAFYTKFMQNFSTTRKVIINNIIISLDKECLSKQSNEDFIIRKEKGYYKDIFNYLKKEYLKPGGGVSEKKPNPKIKKSILPEIPGLEGFDKGLEPSKDGSIPLERDPSTRISASSISSQVPPIWRKWSSPPIVL